MAVKWDMGSLHHVPLHKDVAKKVVTIWESRRIATLVWPSGCMCRRSRHEVFPAGLPLLYYNISIWEYLEKRGLKQVARGPCVILCLIPWFHNFCLRLSLVSYPPWTMPMFRPRFDWGLVFGKVNRGHTIFN